MIRRSLALALVLATTQVAVATPKKKDARAFFDKGVAAYTKGDYQGAADALGTSYALERDAETLFAWAQTERKLGRCDKAIELYQDLLTMKLPAENKKAVEVQIDECKAQLEDEKKAAAAAQEDKQPDPGATGDAPEGTSSTSDAAVSTTPEQGPAPALQKREQSWFDPIGAPMIGVGIVGLVLGGVFLAQGSAADSDKVLAMTYDEYESLDAKAESRGQLGVISLGVGGALVIGGIIRYATRSPASESRTVSGWVAPSGGGFAVSGRF